MGEAADVYQLAGQPEIDGEDRDGTGKHTSRTGAQWTAVFSQYSMV